MFTMETLQQLIRDAIDRRQITISGLAKDCGCSRQHIYHILEDERQPTFDLVQKILHALDAEIVVKKRKPRKKLGS